VFPRVILVGVQFAFKKFHLKGIGGLLTMKGKHIDFFLFFSSCNQILQLCLIGFLTSISSGSWYLL